jgi:hypothetical protein
MKIKAIISEFCTLIILLGITLNACERHEHTGYTMASQKTGLKLSETQIQLANIKVDQITKGVLKHQLLLSGILKVDERSVSSISARSEGVIQKLYFKNTGELVNDGDALYDIYGEKLVSLAREYQDINDYNRGSNRRPDIEIDAENRLLLQGLLPS